MSPLIQLKDQILIKRTTPSHIAYWRHHHLLAGEYSGYTPCYKGHTKCGNYILLKKGMPTQIILGLIAQSIIGKVRKIKKGEREIDVNSLRWKTFNRTMGIGLLCAFALRAVGRRIPNVPEWLKKLVGRAFAIFAWFKNKTLRLLLHQ